MKQVCCQEFNTGRDKKKIWGWPHQRHSGTQFHRCGCSLPGLTGFTVSCCGGTSGATITAFQDKLPESGANINKRVCGLQRQIQQLTELALYKRG
jgi:hypothetical protein